MKFPRFLSAPLVLGLLAAVVIQVVPQGAWRYLTESAVPTAHAAACADTDMDRVAIELEYAIIKVKDRVYFHDKIHKRAIGDWVDASENKPWGNAVITDLDLTETPMANTPTTPQAVVLAGNHVYLNSNILAGADWQLWDRNAPWGTATLRHASIGRENYSIYGRFITLMVATDEKIYFLSQNTITPPATGINVWMDVTKNKPWGNSSIQGIDAHALSNRMGSVLVDGTIFRDASMTTPTSLWTAVPWQQPGIDRFGGNSYPTYIAKVGSAVYYSHNGAFSLINDNRPWGTSKIQDVATFSFSWLADPWHGVSTLGFIAVGGKPYIHWNPSNPNRAPDAANGYDWEDASDNAPWNQAGGPCGGGGSSASSAQSSSAQSSSSATAAQCSNGTDDDGDGKIDGADPGCHSDGNPYNPASYNPNDNDESNPGNAQCNDGADNDADGKADMQDPGCHSDGNAGNAASYVPLDNDETDGGSSQSSQSSACPEVRMKVDLTPIQNSLGVAGLGNSAVAPSGVFFPLKSNGAVLTDSVMPITDHRLGIRRHASFVEFFARNAAVSDESKLSGVITISGGTFTGTSPNPVSVTAALSGLEAAQTNGQGSFEDFIRITSPTTAEFAIFWSQPGDGFTLSYNAIAGNACPNPVPECRDGLDNDGDGATDFPADFSCSGSEDNDETFPKAQCQDGFDNDGDGKADTLDPGCHSDGNANNANSFNPQDNDEFNAASSSSASSALPQCRDSIDNDGDGATDYPADFSCSGPDDNDENLPKAACQDGTDNDGDTLADANDPGCHTDGNAGNPNSYNRQDNDEFNAASSSSSSSLPQCRDGIDNDGDGAVDYNDSGCYTNGIYNPNDNDESTVPQCRDGIDNDGDGAADYPADFSCSHADDTDETFPKASCQDGVDNDGDGLTDFPNDPGCQSRQDNDEFNQASSAPFTPQCRDAIDNDGDGAVDYYDSGCYTNGIYNPNDNDESTQASSSSSSSSAGTLGCILVLNETFNAAGQPLQPSAQFTYSLDGQRTTANDAAGVARFDNVQIGTHTVTQGGNSAWTTLSVTPTGGTVWVPGGTACAAAVFKNKQNSVGGGQSSSHAWYDPYDGDDGYDEDEETPLCRALRAKYGERYDNVKKRKKLPKSIRKALEECDNDGSPYGGYGYGSR